MGIKASRQEVCLSRELYCRLTEKSFEDSWSYVKFRQISLFEKKKFIDRHLPLCGEKLNVNLIQYFRQITVAYV